MGLEGKAGLATGTPRLEGRVALVTGAESPFGAAVARLLAAAVARRT
jgi:NAD(P)-dependent dehydrogenase (short-subunit alcohol dehydrogenase family)